MINVIICGANGKMGRVIESCVKARNDMRVVAGVDMNTAAYSDFDIYKSIDECHLSADVLIDFSHPSMLDALLEYGKRTKTSLVLATTGYTEEQITQIKEASKNAPVFFTFNMSLGINLLVDLAKKATEILGGQFDIEIIEKHHNQKIDAPSGTAIMLANAVNGTLDNSMKYEYDRHSRREKRTNREIGIHSIRGGTIVGEHEILFAGRDETITLSHTATSKEVFAVGAVNAAAYMVNKPAGMYDMSSLLKEG